MGQNPTHKQADVRGAYLSMHFQNVLMSLRMCIRGWPEVCAWIKTEFLHRVLCMAIVEA